MCAFERIEKGKNFSLKEIKNLSLLCVPFVRSEKGMEFFMKKILLLIVFILSVIVSLNLIILIAVNVNKLITYWKDREVRAKLEVVKEIRQELLDYNLNNYYIKIIHKYNDEKPSIIEIYKKDDKVLMSSTNGKNVAKEYRDSEKMASILEKDNVVTYKNVKYFEKEEDVQNLIGIDPKKHEFLLGNYSDKELLEILRECEITTKKYNDEEVYVFKTYYDDYDNSYVKSSYVDKDTGLVLYEFEEMKEFDLKGKEFWKQISYKEYTYEFGTVTDEDVAIPDLSGYEKIENNTY